MNSPTIEEKRRTGRGPADELDLHQLRVIDVLIRERSVTRAAAVLDSTQPALSKTLNRLRRYFGDPLFVRVALQMEPTPKALSLASSVRLILDQVRGLQADHAPFDPQRSDRTFGFLAADAAVVVMLPPVVKMLQKQAPNIRLRAVQLEAEHLHDWLQSGKVDLAIGSYPLLAQGIRRQRLFSSSYMSLVRRGHPRMKGTPSAAEFVGEKHVLVDTAGTGHGMKNAEEALEVAIPQRSISIRVPSFIAAALAAKRTDAIVTLPSPLAAVLARELDMEMFRPPLRLPKFEVSQYWHERLHREPGNQWMRAVLLGLFGSESRFAADMSS